MHKKIPLEIIRLPNIQIFKEIHRDEWIELVALVRKWVLKHKTPVRGSKNGLAQLENGVSVSKSGYDIIRGYNNLLEFEWSSKCVQNAIYGTFGR
jgi:hypothetical protein